VRAPTIIWCSHLYVCKHPDHCLLIPPILAIESLSGQTLFSWVRTCVSVTLVSKTPIVASESFCGSNLCQNPGAHISGPVFTQPLIAVSERPCDGYGSSLYALRTHTQVAAQLQLQENQESSYYCSQDNKILLILTESTEYRTRCFVGAWACPSSRRFPRGQEEPYRILRRIASLNFSDCLLSNISPAAAEWNRLLVSDCCNKDAEGRCCIFQVTRNSSCLCSYSEGETYPICGRNAQLFTHIESLHSS
jgi:hypothetical protein